MKIAAITMVYKEYEMLRKWYRHYGELIGYENLYVVSHGSDETHVALTPKASHITVPRDVLRGFEGRRQRSLADLQKSLYPYYDCVIRVDVDELLFVDPTLHTSLGDCFESTGFDKTDAWFALGFNLFGLDASQSVDLNSTISEQMRDCVVTSVYSKAVATRFHSVVFLHGALYQGPKKIHIDRYKMPEGLYLAHLKYVNSAQMALANEVRAQMTSKEIHGEDRAEIGPFWENGDEEAKILLRRWRSLPMVAADEEFTKARKEMSSSWRLEGPKSFNGEDARIRVQRYQPRARIRLPDRLIGAF